jgi:hypothetical protein
MKAMNKKEWSIVCTVQTWAVVSFTVGDIVYAYCPVVTPRENLLGLGLDLFI